MNIKQIIEAWIIAYKPTKEQQAKANERAEVCESCPSKTTKLRTVVCKECGCPISKKVFTNEFNPCPLGKWGEIDKNYFKTTQTLL